MYAFDANSKHNAGQRGWYWPGVQNDIERRSDKSHVIKHRKPGNRSKRIFWLFGEGCINGSNFV
jgi:hypothetical protein